MPRALLQAMQLERLRSLARVQYEHCQMPATASSSSWLGALLAAPAQHGQNASGTAGRAVHKLFKTQHCKYMSVRAKRRLCLLLALGASIFQPNALLQQLQHDTNACFQAGVPRASIFSLRSGSFQVSTKLLLCRKQRRY